MDMYGTDGNDEKCGEINFGLDYDFGSQTLKLKIIQVHIDGYLMFLSRNTNEMNRIQGIDSLFYFISHSYF